MKLLESACEELAKQGIERVEIQEIAADRFKAPARDATNSILGD